MGPGSPLHPAVPSQCWLDIVSFPSIFPFPSLPLTSPPLLLFFLNIESHNARLIWNFELSCLYLPRAGNTDLGHPSFPASLFLGIHYSQVLAKNDHPPSMLTQ